MPGTGGLACRQKGPARATKYFSGNAVSVASMCADLHRCRYGTLTRVARKNQPGMPWTSAMPRSPPDRLPAPQ